MDRRTGISAGAVVLAGAGAVAVWAGVKGVGLAGGFRTVLAGHALPAGEDLTVTADPAGELAGVSGIGSASDVAAAATRYVGSGALYRWGGGNPRDGWDCSGFVNYLVGHDLGAAIPGYGPGAFTGQSHGPVTSQWAVWSGADSVDRAQLQPGDLVIWPLQHMGIAVDAHRMVSAPGPNGTPAPVFSTIDGFAGGPVVYRRLRR